MYALLSLFYVHIPTYVTETGYSTRIKRQYEKFCWTILGVFAITFFLVFTLFQSCNIQIYIYIYIIDALAVMVG